MSTSGILLDQIFNASDVDIKVFEPRVLFPPVPALLLTVFGNKSKSGKKESYLQLFEVT